MTWGRPVGSLYLGGGTPSLFKAEQIDKLLSALRARLEIKPDAEITLEANPGTLEHDSFTAYVHAGVNRFSLGVQSFDDQLLRRIGRIHTAGETAKALHSLASAGITNFNIDLMYGLPGQCLVQLKRDVAMAIDARPAHISFYQLTVEPNTAFAADPPLLPDEDLAWEMQNLGMDMLATAGYEQYEISAYAQPGRRSRHNLNYWRYGDFLAIGAGAHGKITLPGENRIRRFAKHRHPKRYLQGLHRGSWLAEERDLGARERVFGFFLNQLRLKHGVYIDDFGARTGLSWSTVESRVHEALEKDLLTKTDQRLVPTTLGWKFVNDIQQMFLP